MDDEMDLDWSDGKELGASGERKRGNRVGRGFQEGMRNCPTCGCIMNGVDSSQGNAGDADINNTMLLCPVAIGEQVRLGPGHQGFPPGSKHTQLDYWVVIKGQLTPYMNKRGDLYDAYRNREVEYGI